MTKSHTYAKTKCENEVPVGKLVQMMPRHLRSLRLRVANAKAKIPAFNEIHTQITIFINSDSNALQHQT